MLAMVTVALVALAPFVMVARVVGCQSLVSVEPGYVFHLDYLEEYQVCPDE